MIGLLEISVLKELREYVDNRLEYLKAERERANDLCENDYVGYGCEYENLWWECNGAIKELEAIQKMIKVEEEN